MTPSTLTEANQSDFEFSVRVPVSDFWGFPSSDYRKSYRSDSRALKKLFQDTPSARCYELAVRGRHRELIAEFVDLVEKPELLLDENLRILLRMVVVEREHLRAQVGDRVAGGEVVVLARLVASLYNGISCFTTWE